MKTVRLAIMSVFAFAALSIPALAQAEAKASQAEAARQFPDLAKAGSDFNKAFLAKLQAAKAAHDPTLSRNDWPMILAGAVASEIGVKPAAQPADPAKKSDIGELAEVVSVNELEGFLGIKWGATMDEANRVMLARNGVSKSSYPIEAASLCKFAVMLSELLDDSFSRDSKKATADCLVFLGGTVAEMKVERICLIFVDGKFRISKLFFPRDGNGESGNGVSALNDMLKIKYGKGSSLEVAYEGWLGLEDGNGEVIFEDGVKKYGTRWKFPHRSFDPSHRIYLTTATAAEALAPRLYYSYWPFEGLQKRKQERDKAAVEEETRQKRKKVNEL